MSEKRARQTSDAEQKGGGLNPGQDYMDLYEVKPDSHSSEGAGSPEAHSHDRGKQGQ